MAIVQRESFVVHFYHADSGHVVARVNDLAAQKTWTAAHAQELRALLAVAMPAEEIRKGHS